MKRAGLVALALLCCGATSLTVGGRRIRGPAPRGSQLTTPATQLGTFSFATASGIGMGAACAGVGITGTRGENITVVRASDTYCTKGNETTNIAPGDLVLIGAGQPVVMPGGSGGLPLGELVQSGRTQKLWHTDDMTVVPWTLESVGVADPTVTKNGCTGPDGQMSGTRVVLPPTTAGQDSAVRQDIAGLSGTNSSSIYMRATSVGSCPGPVDFAHFDGAWQCTFPDPSSSTFWIRPKHEGAAMASYFLFGNAGFRCGQARPACDLCVWGPQVEDGSTVSSFMPNPAGADATRASDIVSMPVTVTGNLVDMSATYLAPSFVPTNDTPFSLESTVSDSWIQGFFNASDQLTCRFRKTGVNTDVTSAAALTLGASNVVRCFRNATSYGSCIDGACTSVTGQLLPEVGAAILYIGAKSTGNTVSGGVMKNFVGTTAPGPTNAAVGDSIDTAGFGNWAGRYGTDTNRAVSNYAQSGEGWVWNGPEIQTQWANIPADDKLLIAQALVGGGVNDLIHDVSGAAILAALTAFVDARLAEGRAVILRNVGPWKNSVSWTAPRQTQTDVVNAGIAAYCAAHPAVACVDNMTLLEDAPGSKILAAAFNSGDDIHPNGTGGQVLADDAKAKAP